MVNGKTVSGKAVTGMIATFVLFMVSLAWVFRPRVEPIPELYPMPSFALTSEQGTPFGSADLAGQVVIANFIFTSCPTVCPTLTTHMAELQQRLAKVPSLHLVSFSVDPKNDTPERLKEYGAKFGQDPKRWTFVTGGLSEIEKAVQEGFKVGMKGAGDPNATAFDIVHGEHFVLVDPKGTIRGYYQPRAEEFDRLVVDVVRLLDESNALAERAPGGEATR